MLHVARRNFRENEPHSGYSVLFSMILALVIGFYFVINAISIYVQSLNYADPLVSLQFVQQSFFGRSLFPYPVGSYVLFAVLFFITVIVVYIFLVKSKESKSSDGPNSNNGSSGQTNGSKAILSIDLELSRKAFHIALIGVIVCYIIIGQLVTTGVFEHLAELYSADRFINNFIPYGDLVLADYLPWMGNLWAMFVFIVVFFLAIFTDFVRLYEPRYNPLKAVAKSWRESERRTFAPHVYICIGCLIPVIFFKPPIAAAAIGIAALGDASATIIGITQGTHRVRNTKKTWEGCLGGFIGSFAFAFLCYLAIISLTDTYGASYAGTVGGGVIIALVGATTFFLLDYLNPPISDNVLNPVFCGITMFLVSLVII